jgi:hypothetical protein
MGMIATKQSYQLGCVQFSLFYITVGIFFGCLLLLSTAATCMTSCLLVSIILLKHKLKCHIASSRSLSRSKISTLIRENQRKKKKDLYPLFYLKSFRWLRSNPVKLISIQVGSFSIWNKINNPD